MLLLQYELDKDKKSAIREMRLSQDPHKLAKALRDYGTGQMNGNFSQSLTNTSNPAISNTFALAASIC
jgi:hypothetical protein